MGKIISIVAPTRSGKSFLAERLADHYDAPALYEYEMDANTIPEQVQNSLRRGGSIDAWLYFRNRHATMQLEASKLAKEHRIVFMDTSWITDKAYIAFSNVDTFHEELLLGMHALDRATLPWPDVIIALTCDDATSERLWRSSGKNFERDETYFAERLLPLKREFVKELDNLALKSRVIPLDRTNLDFAKPQDLKTLTDLIDAEI